MFLCLERLRSTHPKRKKCFMLDILALSPHEAPFEASLILCQTKFCFCISRKLSLLSAGEEKSYLVVSQDTITFVCVPLTLKDITLYSLF